MLKRSLQRFLVLSILIAGGCSGSQNREGSSGRQTGVIQPEGEEAAGILDVETEEDPPTSVVGSDSDWTEYKPFRVYTKQGDLVIEVKRRSLYPVRVAVGEYLLTTRVDRQWRQVEVVVKTGQTTKVKLSDFRAGPITTK